MKGICAVCKREAEDVRMYTTDGAYGLVDIQTCEVCHDKEMASIRAESRRFRMRLKTVPWSRLTCRGAYSEVR